MDERPSFDAFFSYASAADFAIVRRLERDLEGLHRRLAFRSARLRPLSICVDGSDLQLRAEGVSPDLRNILVAHLQRSRYLVVFCSTAASVSSHVDFEIRWWLEHKSALTIVTAVTDRRDEDPIGQVFPPALLEAGLDRAIWLDLRHMRRRWWHLLGTAPGGRNTAEEKLRLAALLHGFANIPAPWQRAQTVKRWTGLAAVLLIAGSATGGYAWTTTDAFAVRQMLLASIADEDLTARRSAKRIVQLASAGYRAEALGLLGRVKDEDLSDTACLVASQARLLDPNHGTLLGDVREAFNRRKLQPPACRSSGDDGTTSSGRAGKDFCVELGHALWWMPTAEVRRRLASGNGIRCSTVELPTRYDRREPDTRLNARFLTSSMLALDSAVVTQEAKAQLYQELVVHYSSYFYELPTIRTLASRYPYRFKVARPLSEDPALAPFPLLLGMEPDAPEEPDPPPKESDIRLGWMTKNAACVYVFHGLGRSFVGQAGAAERGADEGLKRFMASSSADHYGLRCVIASLGVRGQYAQGIRLSLENGNDRSGLPATILLYALMQAASGDYAAAWRSSKLFNERHRTLDAQADIVDIWLERR